MAVTTLKQGRVDKEAFQFLSQLAQAEGQKRLREPELAEALIGRGTYRRLPRCKSLSEMDKDFN